MTASTAREPQQRAVPAWARCAVAGEGWCVGCCGCGGGVATATATAGNCLSASLCPFAQRPCRHSAGDRGSDAARLCPSVPGTPVLQRRSLPRTPPGSPPERPLSCQWAGSSLINFRYILQCTSRGSPDL